MYQHLIERVIALAEESLARGGFPNGALVAYGETIIAESISMSEQIVDPTAHAEVTALRRACEQQQSSSLHGYTLYTSLEPCLMCLHSSYWAGIREIVAACRGDRVKSSCYEGTLSAREAVPSLHQKVELMFDDAYAERVQALHLDVRE